MAINSVGIGAGVLSQSVVTLKNQLGDLQTQMATGKKSTTYAGMGVNEGFAIAARAQLANISAFTDTMAKVTTSLNATNTALQSLSNMFDGIQTGAASTSQNLNQNGQTIAQQNAGGQLASMLDILNTRVGDRYLFSGSAIDTPAVVSDDMLLNGTSTQAGLRQVISERQQADGAGAGGLGRLVITGPTIPTPTALSVAEDASPSPFGLKLAAFSSTLTGATVSGPAGTPAAVSIDLGPTNPNPGDQVTFTFNLPDGTTDSVQLTASNTTPLPAGSFAIGATSAVTAANLNAALTAAIGKVADTSLVAASAVTATNNFFAAPPQRVGTTPLATATTLVNGTSANTVSWYTGEAGATPARATAVARIDASATVQYGARAIEPAIVNELKSIAILAAVTTSLTDPNGGAQVAGLSSRVAANMTVQSGQQTLQSMQIDFANAQTVMKDASGRQAQTQTMLQTMVDQTEGISNDQVASQLLALQTSLQASYQTTSMLSQLSLTKFL